jgi:16S rRNA (guanine966-N2)-methyltransferase
MRIIAGSAGGIPIAVPKTSLRPTTDRVREAVFSILGTDLVEGGSVLDLFAGSGSYGLECLSRGAARVVFVETDRAAAEVIRGNLQKARLTGGVVQQSPVESWLRGRGREGATAQFRLIFADPPYAKQRGDIDWGVRMLEDPVLPKLLEAGGWLVLETFARGNAGADGAGPWLRRDERRYGDAMVGFYQLKPSSDDAADHSAAL